MSIIRSSLSRARSLLTGSSRPLSGSLLRPGAVSPQVSFEDMSALGIPTPPYAATGSVPEMDSPVNSLTSPEEVESMRRACRLAAEMREYGGSLAKVGVTTDEIDRQVHEAIVARGAYPSPLNYKGFPKSLCSSVNEVICHGIPDSRPLEDGDIVNLDVSVYVDGFHGDTSSTFLVGDVDERGRDLVDATTEALCAGVAVCGPGVRICEIGSAIHRVARERGYGVVRNYCGHGIGRSFHMLPYIFHYENNQGGVMEEGMVFTIEPMLVEGNADDQATWPDRWTVTTSHGGRSAQQEHTLLVTSEGVQILTSLD